MSVPREVVVTGLGFVSCLGTDQATVVNALREMRHGIRLFPPFADEGMPVKVAAPIDGFDTSSTDAEDWVFPDTIRFRLEQLRALSPNALYAFFALKEALADCGWTEEEISNPRTGLFTASAGSGNLTHFHVDRLKRYGPQRVSPLGIVASIAGTLNFNLVPYYRIQGSSAGFVSACASSGHALGFARDEIALGRQDRMIVVGAEDFTAETILSFASMRVLSPSRDPDRASRPFDRDRDGFVGTGGAVAMILEEAGQAHARGARIYGNFCGWGQSTDGHHMAIAHPEGAGLARAMEHALAASGIAPGEIDYLNAHATSTIAGDVAECHAIRRVFGEGGRCPLVSSTKALTGHALSLSSVMEAAFTVCAMHHGFTPGSANITELAPEAARLRILRETIAQGPRVAMSNSSGFGGANVSLIFSKEGE